MAEAAFGNWIDDAQWDTIQLGGVFLPGVCSIDDFEYGQDIDVQKKRKKEKARLRDNGLAPCGFTITVELTAADWDQWKKILPSIQPRRTGAIRQPLKIVHPIANVSGVQDVYVHNIRYGEATARKGLTIKIKVAEWFEEEKDAVQKKTVASNAPLSGYRRPDYFGDPNELARRLDMNSSGIPALDANTMMDNAFSPEGNDQFDIKTPADQAAFARRAHPLKK